MNYLWIKYLHVTCAIITAAFFCVRGFWMVCDSSMLQRRWVRIVPHVVDTLLLTSALVMVFWSHQYPFQQNWLTSKILALVAYIVLGTVALKRGKTKQLRVFAFVAALGMLAFIFTTALTRRVIGM